MKKAPRERPALEISSDEIDRITCYGLRDCIRLCEWELAQPVIHTEDAEGAKQAMEAAKYLLEWYGDRR